jgi:hypothetical protein
MKKLILLGLMIFLIGLVLFFISGTTTPEGELQYPFLYGPQQILFLTLMPIGLLIAIYGLIKKSEK